MQASRSQETRNEEIIQQSTVRPPWIALLALIHVVTATIRSNVFFTMPPSSHNATRLLHCWSYFYRLAFLSLAFLCQNFSPSFFTIFFHCSLPCSPLLLSLFNDLPLKLVQSALLEQFTSYFTPSVYSDKQHSNA